MPIVELVAFDGCPNRDRARANLQAALAETGHPSVWHELDASGPDVSDYARGWGSPTILVDGVDVAGASALPGGLASCRLYGSAGDRGAPSVAMILAALRSGSPRPGDSGASS